MEKFATFMKKHSVLLLGVAAGLLLIIVVCGFAFGRHDRDGRFDRGFGPQQMGACGMEQGGKGGEQGCPMAQGKGGMEAGCPMAGGPVGPGMAGGPGMGCDGEGKMQKHLCQSGSLESGAVQQLLVGLDMKINNLTLIKTNMQSMAQRTNVPYATGDMESLDKLLSGFDAQRKLLETNPESFCAETGTRTTLNEDMRKVMMEGVSGQVNKFKEQGRGGMGMMRGRFGR